jgi:hypothetical protein
MIFRRDTTITPVCADRASFWESEHYACIWKGLVFIPGVEAGSPSIAHFISMLSGAAIPQTASRFKGLFLLVVQHKRTAQIFAFVDNGGLYKAYYSDRAIGSSYLELVRSLELSRSDISPEAVVEFLHHGNVFDHKTLTPVISKIRHDEILTFAEDGTVEKLSKMLPGIDTAPRYDPRDFFHDLSISVRNQRVSVDLTGGFDSRLIACLLDNEDLDFECALSGMPGIRDLAIGGKVADAMDRPFHVTYHQLGSPSQDIPELFNYTDGLLDVLTYHRVAQLQCDRMNRGITLALCGAGGGLYKDYWWLHDFPFYNLKRPNLQRLYDLRIEKPHFPHNYFAGEMRDMSESLRARTLRRLLDFVRDSNTTSYDWISYYYKMQELHGTILTVTTNQFVNMYAPLMDYELAAFGYALPRRRRFFDLFLRSLLHETNPRVARIVTTQDTSASMEPMNMAQDVFLSLYNKGKRGLRKLGERFTGRTHFLESPDHPDFRRMVFDDPIMDEAFRVVEDCRLLNPTLAKTDLRLAHIGRILTLGMLLKELR